MGSALQGINLSPWFPHVSVNFLSLVRGVEGGGDF